MRAATGGSDALQSKLADFLNFSVKNRIIWTWSDCSVFFFLFFCFFCYQANVQRYHNVIFSTFSRNINSCTCLQLSSFNIKSYAVTRLVSQLRNYSQKDYLDVKSAMNLACG